MIGRGGMGSVWEAWHQELRARVACKFIDRNLAKLKPGAVSRFRSEARAAAALQSKHVVDVYDFGTMTDGTPYMVMEYLEGESLGKRLSVVDHLDRETTLSVISQVGKALARAHEKGIIHRDLKPDNIFLVWDEEDEREHVKVVDFGIAKFSQSDVLTTHTTKSDALLGTPAYMSPEQIRGEGVVDQRADLWAMGVVVYRCLTGELPFYGSTMGDILVQICTQEAKAPTLIDPELPQALDAWMKKALARDPAQRFSNVRELVTSLSASLGIEMKGMSPTLPDGQRDGSFALEEFTASPPPATEKGKRGFHWAALVAAPLAAGLGFFATHSQREAMEHGSIQAETGPLSLSTANLVTGSKSARYPTLDRDARDVSDPNLPNLDASDASTEKQSEHDAPAEEAKNSKQPSSSSKEHTSNTQSSLSLSTTTSADSQPVGTLPKPVVKAHKKTASAHPAATAPPQSTSNTASSGPSASSPRVDIALGY